MIGYLSKGGVTYSDTEDMTPYERKIVLDTLSEIYTEKSNAQQQIMDEAKLKQQNSSPKSGGVH